MAQIKFRADTHEIDFPLLSDWAGRTIMQAPPDIGQHYVQDSTAMYQPGVIYLQDVLPTSAGYKSVSYTDIIGVASPANLNFTKVYTVLDAAMNVALIGITNDSHIYMITASSFIWVDVTPASWVGGDAVTVGDANGTYYLYLSKFGCYAVNITGVALTSVTLTGITAANILGIFSCINYLLLWDTQTIYWSNTSNPLDFVPSLITGAGSEVPNSLAGHIIYCEALDNGYAIYSSLNIVLAAFSNNTQYPWLYVEANNGAGITDMTQVSSARSLGMHTVFTYGGLTQVTPTGCVLIQPEVTDFIASRIYESYDTVNNIITQTALTANLNCKVTITTARYVVLSYGVTTPTDALVFDMILKRWGKLHLNHVSCFEIETSVLTPPIPYVSAADVGFSYASASPQPYNIVTSSFANAPEVGNTLGFLCADGSIKMAHLDYTSDTDSAVLILGKFQLVRTNLMDLHELELETIPSSSRSLQVLVQPSMDGNDSLPVISPTLVTTGAKMRKYKLRTECLNYNLIFKGSFNLTSVLNVAVVGPRR